MLSGWEALPQNPEQDDNQNSQVPTLSMSRLSCHQNQSQRCLQTQNFQLQTQSPVPLHIAMVDTEPIPTTTAPSLSPPHSGTLAPVSCFKHILKRTLHTSLILHVLPAALIPISSLASRKVSKFYFTSARSFSFLSVQAPRVGNSDQTEVSPDCPTPGGSLFCATAQCKSTALLLCTCESGGEPVNKCNYPFLSMHVCMYVHGHVCLGVHVYACF